MKSLLMAALCFFSISAHAGYTSFGDRNWTLGSGLDSVTSFQGGSWTTNRSWNLSSGSDSVTVSNAKGATYSTSVSGFSPASGSQDIWCITGSATKTVEIKDISFSMTKSTAGNLAVILLKHSSLDTGGTVQSLVNVAHDPSDPAATASVNYYTASPSSGGFVGFVRSAQILAGTTANPTQLLDWRFGQYAGTKALLLTSASQQYCINLAGATIASPQVSISVEWTEY